MIHKLNEKKKHGLFHVSNGKLNDVVSVLSSSNSKRNKQKFVKYSCLYNNMSIIIKFINTNTDLLKMNPILLNNIVHPTICGR